jgi:hypothetical protein
MNVSQSRVCSERVLLCAAGGIAEEYDEDEDEEGYVTEDSVDPDNMTYEVPPCTCALHPSPAQSLAGPGCCWVLTSHASIE